jgi:hypothetical protein
MESDDRLLSLLFASYRVGKGRRVEEPLALLMIHL